MRKHLSVLGLAARGAVGRILLITVLTAALAIGLGNVLNREIVQVELAGSRNAPAVVITRGESAVVLFRGGSSTQQAVETLLTRRGAREVEMLVDLRNLNH